MENLYEGFKMKLIKKFEKEGKTHYFFNNGYGAIFTDKGNDVFDVSLIQFNIDLKSDTINYGEVKDSIIPCITLGISYNELSDLLDDISALKYRIHMSS